MSTQAHNKLFTPEWHLFCGYMVEYSEELRREQRTICILNVTNVENCVSAAFVQHPKSNFVLNIVDYWKRNVITTSGEYIQYTTDVSVGTKACTKDKDAMKRTWYFIAKNIFFLHAHDQDIIQKYSSNWENIKIAWHFFSSVFLYRFDARSWLTLYQLRYILNSILIFKASKRVKCVNSSGWNAMKSKQ